MKKSQNSNRKKGSKEVGHIKEVQSVVRKAMTEVISYLQNSEVPTSEEAHTLIETTLNKYNCHSPHGYVVAGGKQSAEPHEKGQGHIKKGVPIVIDIFPQSKKSGYFADMSRTVCIGKPPSELQKMYDAVLAAQELAISMVKPGVSTKEMQYIVEEFFDTQGYITSGVGKEFEFAEGFVHGLGHGVGLQVHEEPHLSRRGSGLLQEGDVITIEPGLYYKNIGGIRIEDMLLVTANGSRNLTNFSKTFEI